MVELHVDLPPSLPSSLSLTSSVPLYSRALKESFPPSSLPPHLPSLPSSPLTYLEHAPVLARTQIVPVQGRQGGIEGVGAGLEELGGREGGRGEGGRRVRREGGGLDSRALR